MHRVTDDCIKRRLIDSERIALAVDYLIASGVAEDMIAVELSKKFYVDIDVLNAVLDRRDLPPRRPPDRSQDLHVVA